MLLARLVLKLLIFSDNLREYKFYGKKRNFFLHDETFSKNITFI